MCLVDFIKGVFYVRGGKFGHGFVSAGLSGGKVGSNPYAQVIMGAVLGGTSSKLTGGKFANGAISGAFAALTKEPNKDQAEGKQRVTVDTSQIKTDADKQFVLEYLKTLENDKEISRSSLLSAKFRTLSVSLETQVGTSIHGPNMGAAVGVAGHVGLVGTAFEKGIIHTPSGQMCYTQLCARYGPGMGANVGGVFSISPGSDIAEGRYKTSGLFLEAGQFAISHTSDDTLSLSHEKVGLGWLYAAGYQQCHATVNSCSGD